MSDCLKDITVKDYFKTNGTKANEKAVSDAAILAEQLGVDISRKAKIACQKIKRTIITEKIIESVALISSQPLKTKYNFVYRPGQENIKKSEIKTLTIRRLIKEHINDIRINDEAIKKIIEIVEQFLTTIIIKAKKAADAQKRSIITEKDIEEALLDKKQEYEDTEAQNPKQLKLLTLRKMVNTTKGNKIGDDTLLAIGTILENVGINIYINAGRLVTSDNRSRITKNDIDAVKIIGGLNLWGAAENKKIKTEKHTKTKQAKEKKKK